jgi:hypothetical protein
LAVTRLLGELVDPDGSSGVLGRVRDRLSTVATGARCNLARQTEAVTSSLIARFGDDFASRDTGRAEAVEPYLVAPIVDIVGDRAVLDPDQATRHPDWSHGPVDSGAWPAQLLADVPVDVRVPRAELTDAIGRGVGTGIGRSDGDAEATVTTDPFERLGRAHAEAREQVARVVEQPTSTDARDRMATSVRDMVDVTVRIITPMARRHGGAAGDEISWTIEEHDRQMIAALDGRGAEPAELAEAVGRHIELEDRMLDQLRAELDETELADLAAAIGEAQYEVGEHTVQTRA